MFEKVLVANRGEIACRVLKTLKKMGISTVAIYSEADRNSQHIALADETFLIGPAESSRSYLSIDNIIDVAKNSKVDAIHPGYGFLSENPEFVRRIELEDITFIGPNSKLIAIMGDKIEAKKIAEKVNIKTVPGGSDAINRISDGLNLAEKIGYPVILKPAAGGGGKGMRIVSDRRNFKDLFIRTQSESLSSFGDDRIFLEKYIKNPRHIEIQIICDNYGNMVHLGERECSIQRRHQKIIEESPSSILDPVTRARMGEQSLKLARSVSYSSAGTIEFLLDQDKEFYFLEMNTRIQVEHPVTELVTGLDIVELMVRIASGEKLNLNQNCLKFSGYAIEARICAESPERDFLPSIGRLIKYCPPREYNGIRVDSGVIEGSEISIHYDSMIAKVISYGKNRQVAIDKLAAALELFFVKGVDTNILFLSAILNNHKFKTAQYSTNFITEEWPDSFVPKNVCLEDLDIIRMVAAVVHFSYEKRARLSQKKSLGRLENEFDVVIDNRVSSVSIETIKKMFNIKLNQKEFTLKSNWSIGECVFFGFLDDSEITLQIEKVDNIYCIQHKGAKYSVNVFNKFIGVYFKLMPEKENYSNSKELTSPMPGLVISILVKEGDKVLKGDNLIIIESMKMENILSADSDGIISKINIVEGASVKTDQSLFKFL